MQNLAFRVPALLEHRIRYPNGSVTVLDKPSSSRVITRSQIGYTGKRPKGNPMPPHAYSLSVQDLLLHADSSYTFKSDGRVEYQYGPALYPGVWGVTYDPAPVYTDLYNEALDKFNRKVRGDLDISVDLAQASQVRRMLNYQQKVLDYEAVFYGRHPYFYKISRSRGMIKLISAAYLEWLYGVKPLLQTVFDAADENIRVVINKTARFSARASAEFNPSYAIFRRFDSEYVRMPVTSSKMKISVTIGADLRTNKFDYSRWSSLNPVSIAWETLPYSFVVDWFYNVGGYLRNLETYLLYWNDFRSGYRTNLLVGMLGCDLYASSNTAINQGYTKYTGKLKTVGIERTVLASYPAPAPPSFRASLGSSRLLAGAALLAQQLSSRSSRSLLEIKI